MRLGLVDELTIYVAPLIFGGESSNNRGRFRSGKKRRDSAKLVESQAWIDGGVLIKISI